MANIHALHLMTLQNGRKKMRDIARSRKFDKEYQKLGGLSAELIDVVYHLLHAIPLPEKYRDHALTGNWTGYRDCHIKPDLVLIYRITDDTLELHRLNSHSEIFG